jgi:tight adherence protein B
MEESLSEAYGELAAMYDPGDCIMREISGMLRSMTEGGQTDIEALEGFARRAGAEDIDIFVQVFRACRETGGDMAGAMNKSAAIIGEKIIIENEIQMMAVQKKYEGRIITAMPVIIIIFLRLAAPEYLEVMYETTAGHLLMTLALAATAGAYYLIERITDIEV